MTSLSTISCALLCQTFARIGTWKKCHLLKSIQWITAMAREPRLTSGKISPHGLWCQLLYEQWYRPNPYPKNKFLLHARISARRKSIMPNSGMPTKLLDDDHSSSPWHSAFPPRRVTFAEYCNTLIFSSLKKKKKNILCTSSNLPFLLWLPLCFTRDLFYFFF